MELVTAAADTLDACMMARFDRRSGNLGVTELGRIASHYYIKHGTIEAFNSMLTPHLSEQEGLHVLCSSAEFDQLKLRPEELVEIESLRKEATFLKVRAGSDDTAGKVNVLLQAYLTQTRISSFTLQSDSNYVAQNGGRITRALFEICMKRGWSTMALQFLTLCKVRALSTPHSSLLTSYCGLRLWRGGCVGTRALCGSSKPSATNFLERCNVTFQKEFASISVVYR